MHACLRLLSWCQFARSRRRRRRPPPPPAEAAAAAARCGRHAGRSAAGRRRHRAAARLRRLRPRLRPAPSPKFAFGGLVDTYYMYNFTPPSGDNSLQFPQPAARRRARVRHQREQHDAGARQVDDERLAGRRLACSSTSATARSARSSTTRRRSAAAMPADRAVGNSFLIEQAFGEIALPGNLTLDFGKFTTTAGAEVIEANKNWLYSRSLLFNAIPLLHTGVRANLKINDMLTVQASVVNGWNNDPDSTPGRRSACRRRSPPARCCQHHRDDLLRQGRPAAAGADRRHAGRPALPARPGRRRSPSTAAFGLNLNIDYIKAFDDIVGATTRSAARSWAAT